MLFFGKSKNEIRLENKVAKMKIENGMLRSSNDNLKERISQLEKVIFNQRLEIKNMS